MGFGDYVRYCIDGMVEVAKGAYDFVVGALKMALSAIVWVIRGVFTIAEHLTAFAYNVIKSINTSLFKKVQASTVGPKVLDEIIKKIPHEVGETIDLSKLTNKSLALVEGVNQQGEDVILGAQIVDATDMESRIKDADARGVIYTNPLRT